MLVNDRSDLPNDQIARNGYNQNIAPVAQELFGANRVNRMVEDVSGDVLKSLNLANGKSSKNRIQVDHSREASTLYLK